MMMTWEMISKQQSVYSILDNNPGHKLTFTGEVHGQVFINNVPLVMTRSNMLTMRGVVHTISNLPPVDLAHCIVLQDDTKVGICGDCDQSLACPEGYSPMSADPVIVEGNCTYNITRLIRQEVPGCQQLCHRTIQVDECCPGYYGPTCNECPGGADDPCSGHGNCTDGSRGSGSCICHDGYVGHACAECTTEECLNDPCLIRNGGCHEFASCSVFDDGLVVCDCLLGYTGDGYHCVPVCDVDNGYCPLGSTCVINGDGIVTCLCPDGQILDGSTCWSGSRSCDVDNGGCSQNAKCTDEDGVICHCNYGFVGNGTLCNQDMWTTLLSLAQTSTFADLIQDNAIHSEMVLDLSRLLQDLTQNLTVFVPINTGLDNMGLHVSELERYISKQWIGLYPSEQARSYQALDGSELVIVSAGDKKDTYMVNGVLTVDCNIPVTNGILHLLAGPFSVLPQAQKQLQKTSGMFSHVVGGILGTIIIILVLAFAVWKTKHKTRVLVDRLRRSTVSSFTFANFNADKFNFVRFKPAQPASTGGASSDVDVREEDAADGSPAHEENSAIVGGSHSSFSNPVFGQCPAGEEEQLIFK